MTTEDDHTMTEDEIRQLAVLIVADRWGADPVSDRDWIMTTFAFECTRLRITIDVAKDAVVASARSPLIRCVLRRILSGRRAKRRTATNPHRH